MRALGLDLGTRRVGVAISDGDGTVATPYEVIVRSDDPTVDYRRVAELVREVGADRVVVGLPLLLSGDSGRAARAAREEAQALADVLDVPVELHDERLTTVSALRSLSTSRVKGRQQRRVVDQVAAAVMLQSWLDSRRQQEREA